MRASAGSTGTTKSLTSGVVLDDPADDEEVYAEPSKPMPVKRVAPLMSSKKVRESRLCRPNLEVDLYARRSIISTNGIRSKKTCIRILMRPLGKRLQG